MNFLIRFHFTEFLEGLAAGSTVYSVAYSEGPIEKAEAVVLLTSDAGIAGGPINVLRMTFELNGAGALPVAKNASDKLHELLELRGMSWSQGVLLTEGLNESIREYSGTDPYAIKTIEEWLIPVKKEKQPK